MTNERFYKKCYKHIDKLCKKYFDEDVTGCLALRLSTREKIENVIGKKINEVTDKELVDYNMAYEYSKYISLCAVLRVLESVANLNSMEF